MAQGRRAGLASVGGIETANLVHLVAAALGLSALLMTSAQVLQRGEVPGRSVPDLSWGPYAADP